MPILLENLLDGHGANYPAKRLFIMKPKNPQQLPSPLGNSYKTIGGLEDIIVSFKFRVLSPLSLNEFRSGFSPSTTVTTAGRLKATGFGGRSHRKKHVFPVRNMESENNYKTFQFDGKSSKFGYKMIHPGNQQFPCLWQRILKMTFPFLKVKYGLVALY